MSYLTFSDTFSTSKNCYSSSPTLLFKLASSGLPFNYEFINSCTTCCAAMAFSVDCYICASSYF